MPKAKSSDSLRHRMNYVQRKVEKLKAEMDDEKAAGTRPTEAVIRLRSTVLERCRVQYEELHVERLESATVDEYEKHDDRLIAFEALVEEIQLTLLASNPERRCDVPPTQSVHLPMPIPTFDGQYKNWPKFKQLFSDLLARTNHSDAVKLHNLNSALIGEAAGILNASMICNNNFETAWKLLTNRYENPRVIVESHIAGLLALKRLDKESSKGLRTLVETCRMHTDGLTQMGKPLDDTSALIINQLVISCLDPDTRKLWERTLNHGEFPNLTETLQFIQTQSEVLERCSIGGPSNIRVKSARVCTVAENGCEVCHEEQHPLYKCSKFLEMDAQQRIDKVTSLKRCLRCLAKGHNKRECKSKWFCKECRKDHHYLLHLVRVERQLQPTTSGDQGSVSMQCSNTANATVLLSTAVILVIDRSGKAHEARALIDSGSQLNFISASMAQLLRLPIKSAHVSLVGVGAEPVTTAKQKVVAIVKSRCSDYTATIECMVLPKPTAELPVVTVPGLWKIPEGIALADPTFFHSRRVDMILGAELFAELLQTGKIQLGENQPTLVNSVFGWIVSGKVDPSPPVQANNAVIETLMEKFFAIEDAATNNNLTIEETACEHFYRETTTRHDDGKFVVRLPQKADMINSLGESKSMATKRLLAIEKRLEKEPGTREAYTAFMKEYEELGHMSVVSKEGDGHSTAYYMPHHPVFKADSSTTKCRVVFDASAKSSSGISLNDTLMVGPTLQQEATTILIRFRTKPIALTADIAKMYRQIWVHPSDRHLQRILWRPSRDMPIQEYELNTVTYGTAAAPYLAIKSLQQTAVDHGA